MTTTPTTFEQHYSLQQINAKVGEEAAADMLTVTEFAKRLGLKRATAYKLLAHEPGVRRIHTPGSSKAIIRVPVEVLNRIERRATILA
jgi:predicted DNA-binding transcriptional regulator AlpA